MVAIAIFALIVAAIYSTWVLILKSSQVGQDAAAQVQRQRVAIHTIEDALTCVQSFQASMQYYSFIVQNGTRRSFSFTRGCPIFSAQREIRRLQRAAVAVHRRSRAGFGQSRKDLVLRQKPILLDMDADEQKNPLVLARNVQTFKVECWDTNTAEWTPNGTTPIPSRR
jgi:hypothetical protein